MNAATVTEKSYKLEKSSPDPELASVIVKTFGSKVAPSFVFVNDETLAEFEAKNTSKEPMKWPSCTR